MVLLLHQRLTFSKYCLVGRWLFYGKLGNGFLNRANLRKYSILVSDYTLYSLNYLRVLMILISDHLC